LLNKKVEPTLLQMELCRWSFADGALELWSSICTKVGRDEDLFDGSIWKVELRV
jgi:hypothetical protein